MRIASSTPLQGRFVGVSHRRLRFCSTFICSSRFFLREESSAVLLWWSPKNAIQAADAVNIAHKCRRRSLFSIFVFGSICLGYREAKFSRSLDMNTVARFPSPPLSPEGLQSLLDDHCLEIPQEFLQLGAAAIGPDAPAPSAEDLADQIIENFNYFRVKMGDIIDCIDIYKQPAFDHPSLKHHKI
ncbi:protein NDL1-like isoform X3 [Senna tora]|uniref:Protein NDL1-like isoform X3 n=1 Tax=Senna tora TaxID=362788 RepID=A0A834XC42_9FABA|nr:protein NDL1-like isoform X3 [Senna tora]